jgi:pyrroline-5-carboxylate reductase
MLDKVGVVGLGKMGAAIAIGIHASTKQTVSGFDPFSKTRLPGVEYKSSLLALEESSEIIILAVKPADIVKVISEFQSPKIFISIAAGIPLELMESSAPKGSLFARLMPNLPLVVGRGAIGYYSHPDIVSHVEGLFGGLGILVRLEKESLLDAVTGLSGSGPAYVLTFLHSLAEGGLKEGLSYTQSLELAIETIAGTIEYYKKLKEADKDLHPMEVRNWVTSPGGTTIHGLDSLEKGVGISNSVRDAVASATARSKDLGKKG